MTIISTKNVSPEHNSQCVLSPCTPGNTSNRKITDIAYFKIIRLPYHKKVNIILFGVFGMEMKQGICSGRAKFSTFTTKKIIS